MVIKSHAYVGSLLVTSTMNEPELGVDTVELDADEFNVTAQVGMDGLIVLFDPSGEQFGAPFRVKEEHDRSWTISKTAATGGTRLIVRTSSRLTAIGSLLASF